MRAFLILAMVTASAAFATACNDKGVGRKCVDPTNGGAGAGMTELNSPALDCPERVCFIQSAGKDTVPTRSVCTAPCQTDDDCQGATLSTGMGDSLCPATSGFVCAVATVAGSFCCRKYCICKADLVLDYNQDADGGVITPPACLPGSGASCQNLMK